MYFGLDASVPLSVLTRRFCMDDKNIRCATRRLTPEVVPLKCKSRN